jgi:hypothetical protein
MKVNGISAKGMLYVTGFLLLVGYGILSYRYKLLSVNTSVAVKTTTTPTATSEPTPTAVPVLGLKTTKPINSPTNIPNLIVQDDSGNKNQNNQDSKSANTNSLAVPTTQSTTQPTVRPTYLPTSEPTPEVVINPTPQPICKRYDPNNVKCIGGPPEECGICIEWQ